MEKVSIGIASFIAQKRGFGDVRILQHWNKIADGRLSAYKPIKMSRGILYVFCESKMDAIQLAYIKQYAIDDIKSLFGCEVKDIKLLPSLNNA